MIDLYKDMGEKYFAASNTKDGFVSYFDDVFSEKYCDRIYILKGGPGVGKSTFMKKLAKLSEEKGFGTEYFLCSSDPYSLDGIIIKEKRVAVIDGTNPHSVEPAMAGVREIIVDLGRAWDTDLLLEKKDEITALSHQKKKYYNECYSFLYSKSVMDSLLYNLLFPYILFDKLDRSATRLVKGIFKGYGKSDGPASVKTRITSAMSTQGRIRLSTFEDKAKMCIFIKEPFADSRLPAHYLSAVFDYAKNIGAKIHVSFNPERKNEIDAIFFPEAEVSVSVFDEALVSYCDRIQKKCRIINTARFVDIKGFSHLKPLRKFYSKLSENMQKMALESLENAGKAHAETEKIYRPCTDYGTVEKITNEYLNKII